MDHVLSADVCSRSLALKHTFADKQGPEVGLRFITPPNNYLLKFEINKHDILNKNYFLVLELHFWRDQGIIIWTKVHTILKEYVTRCNKG